MQRRRGATCQRGGQGRIESLWQLDQHLGPRFDKLGKPAIGAEPELSHNVVTEVLLAISAPVTLDAGAVGASLDLVERSVVVIDDDAVAGLDCDDLIANAGDLAHNLMTERQRGDAEIEQAAQKVQLRPTHARVRRAHQNIILAELRHRNRFEA